jgi:hypothetical protein
MNNPIYPPEGVTLPPEPVEKEYEDCVSDKERMQWLLEHSDLETLAEQVIQLEHDVDFLQRRLNQVGAELRQRVMGVKR